MKVERRTLSPLTRQINNNLLCYEHFLAHYWFTIKYRKAIECQDTPHWSKHNLSLFNFHVQNCWCSSIDVCLSEKVKIRKPKADWKFSSKITEDIFINRITWWKSLHIKKKTFRNIDCNSNHIPKRLSPNLFQSFYLGAPGGLVS